MVSLADLEAKYRVQPMAAPARAAASLGDLEQKYAPSSGVTIAPKGGVAREATPQEAGQIDYMQASAGDIAAKAGENLIPSAKQFGSDMLSVVTDPVGTAKNIAKVGVGAVEKLIPGQQAHEPYADAVGQFFADRYGGIENVKRTMAEDPVGFLADVSTVLTGGELALARAPGLVGQVGRAAGTAARAVDPIAGTMKAAGAAAKGAGHVAASIEGTATGTGGATIRQAARTGFEGGPAGQAFRDNMRGNVPMENVITDAKTALNAIKQERSAAYNAGMGDVRASQSVLDINKLDKALANTKTQYTFKGISKDPRASAKLQEVAVLLDDWKKLDPAEFHTAEGFDALKQRVGSILETIPYEQRTARQAIGQVYDAVKGQIEKQAPSYAKTMKDYQVASDLIREIEKTLSLKPNANVDTQLRKLQSVMRNNVNTNYGKRADLVKLLEDHGAQNLMAKLAGQSAASWAPRGLARAVAGLQTVGGVGGAVAALNPMTALSVIPGLAAQSPRLVNELVHAGGRTANALSRVPARNALQAGYAERGTSR